LDWKNIARKNLKKLYDFLFLLVKIVILTDLILVYKFEIINGWKVFYRDYMLLVIVLGHDKWRNIYEINNKWEIV
jgi:hypothetical protein